MIPSGTQVTIRSGDYSATTTEVGGGLRTLTHRGVPLVLGFAERAIRTGYRGSVLAPWPNRVVDGRYGCGGTDFLLPLTEPERGHALHGLVVWDRFTLVESAPDAVVWVLTSVPQPWYPWAIEVRAGYRMDAATGLAWSVSGRNVSDTPAPFGCGIHPYAVAPTGAVDDWTLTLPVTRVQEVTPDRLVPGALVPADAALRSGTSLRERAIDNAFTRLVAGADGTYAASVRDPDGRGVGFRWGPDGPWVQAYTADGMPGGDHRRAVAIEPMTCGPDAFNSAAADVLLAPGESRGLTVTIAALGS